MNRLKPLSKTKRTAALRQGFVISVFLSYRDFKSKLSRVFLRILIHVFMKMLYTLRP